MHKQGVAKTKRIAHGLGSMRTHLVLLSVTVSALSLCWAGLAQAQVPQDPGGLMGAAQSAAQGVLGNSAGSNSAPSSGRSRSRSRSSAAPALGSPLPGNAPRSLIQTQADAYMNLPLETFHNMRRLQPPPFEWTANGCNFGEIALPFRESFNRACDRHDFGYRNYGHGRLQLDRTEARRTRIDDRLRDDLNGLCRRDHAGLTETPCLASAQAVYAAARATGGPQFMSGAAPPPAIPTPAIPGMGGNQNPNPIPGVPLPGLGPSERNRTTTVPMPGAGGGNSGSPLPLPGAGGLPLPGAGGGSPIPGLPNPTGMIPQGR